MPEMPIEVAYPSGDKMPRSQQAKHLLFECRFDMTRTAFTAFGEFEKPSTPVLGIGYYNSHSETP